MTLLIWLCWGTFFVAGASVDDHLGQTLRWFDIAFLSGASLWMVAPAMWFLFPSFSWNFQARHAHVISLWVRIPTCHFWWISWHCGMDTKRFLNGSHLDISPQMPRAFRESSTDRAQPNGWKQVTNSKNWKKMKLVVTGVVKFTSCFFQCFFSSAVFQTKWISNSLTAFFFIS